MALSWHLEELLLRVLHWNSMLLRSISAPKFLLWTIRLKRIHWSMEGCVVLVWVVNGLMVSCATLMTLFLSLKNMAGSELIHCQTVFREAVVPEQYEYCFCFLILKLSLLYHHSQHHREAQYSCWILKEFL